MYGRNRYGTARYGVTFGGRITILTTLILQRGISATVSSVLILQRGIQATVDSTIVLKRIVQSTVASTITIVRRIGLYATVPNFVPIVCICPGSVIPCECTDVPLSAPVNK